MALAPQTGAAWLLNLRTSTRFLSSDQIFLRAHVRQGPRPRRTLRLLPRGLRRNGLAATSQSRPLRVLSQGKANGLSRQLRQHQTPGCLPRRQRQQQSLLLLLPPLARPVVPRPPQQRSRQLHPPVALRPVPSSLPNRPGSPRTVSTLPLHPRRQMRSSLSVTLERRLMPMSRHGMPRCRMMSQAVQSRKLRTAPSLRISIFKQAKAYVSGGPRGILRSSSLYCSCVLEGDDLPIAEASETIWHPALRIDPEGSWTTITMDAFRSTGKGAGHVSRGTRAHADRRTVDLCSAFSSAQKSCRQQP